MHRRLLYLLLLLVIASALLFLRLPIPHGFAWSTLENAGHTPLFFLLTMALLYVLRDQRLFAGWRLYVFSGLAGAGAGLLSEILQRSMRRDPSWEDVFADAVGVVLALAIFAFIHHRSAMHRGLRLLVLTVALACIAVYVAPITTMVRAYLHRNGQFPVLADFHSRLELYWTMSLGVRREIVDDTLRVEFVAEEFPGLSFHEPVPDWSAYKSLVVDVENPAAEPLDLGLRVHDRKHSRQFNDRFNRHFTLAAGERRTLRIDLEEVRHAPRSRLMDMKQISDITLFRGSPTGSRELRVHALRLE